MTQTQKNLLAGLAVVLLAAAAIYFYTAKPAGPGSAATSTAPAATSTDMSGGGTIQIVSDSIPPPSVVPLVFTTTVDAATKARIIAQFGELSAELKASPTRVDLWFGIGVLYKVAGQYQVAAGIWTYVAKAGPPSINYLAYGNLGDLYLNFLHDYPKAVAAYKAALAIQPGVADYQAGLKAAQMAQ